MNFIGVFIMEIGIAFVRSDEIGKVYLPKDDGVNASDREKLKETSIQGRYAGTLSVP